MAKRTKINIQEKPMKTPRIKGKVFSGSGEGSRFIRLPWVKRQIKEKLGFAPYIGTLNIKLTDNDRTVSELLNKASTEISPEKGFCRGKCISALFMGNVKCAILLPEVADYPENVIEIVAPMNLRERCRLRDGDVVTVDILF